MTPDSTHGRKVYPNLARHCDQLWVADLTYTGCGSHCDGDLHYCRNCRFFDPGKHNQCAETQAEWVSEKERANFRDYFEAAARQLSL